MYHLSRYIKLKLLPITAIMIILALRTVARTVIVCPGIVHISSELIPVWRQSRAGPTITAASSTDIVRENYSSEI